MVMQIMVFFQQNSTLSIMITTHIQVNKGQFNIMNKHEASDMWTGTLKTVTWVTSLDTFILMLKSLYIKREWCSG